MSDEALAPPAIKTLSVNAWVGVPLVVGQAVLVVLYGFATVWYLGRGTPEEDQIASYPFDAGGSTNATEFLFRIVPWYAIALNTIFSVLLGASGLVLSRRKRGVLRLALLVGSVVCLAIFVISVTPYGLGLTKWWLD